MGKKARSSSKAERAKRLVSTTSPHPALDAMIIEAMLTPRDELLTHEEVARELGITEEQRAAARAIIDTWEPDEPEEAEPAAAAPQQKSAAVRRAGTRQ